MPALLDIFGLMAWEQGRKKGKKGEKSLEEESGREENKGRVNLYVLVAGNGRGFGICGALETIEDEHKTDEEETGGRCCRKMMDEASRIKRDLESSVVVRHPYVP